MEILIDIVSWLIGKIDKEWIYLFSVTTTVMFWYIDITALSGLRTWWMGWPFSSKISIALLLIVLAVAFDGHKKVVCGLLRKFISVFSLVILSSLSEWVRSYLDDEFVCLLVCHFWMFLKCKWKYAYVLQSTIIGSFKNGG